MRLNMRILLASSEVYPYSKTGGLADMVGSLAKTLEAKFGEPRKASLVWRSQNTVAVDDAQGEKILKLIESLNEQDDVQNVYANFEISDALVSRMSA